MLLTTRLPGRLSQPVGQVMMRAGIDLLPPWAQEMLGLSLTPLQRRTTRLMVLAIARVLRARYVTAPGIAPCAGWRRRDSARLAQVPGNQRLQATVRPPFVQRVIHRVKADHIIPGDADGLLDLGKIIR